MQYVCHISMAMPFSEHYRDCNNVSSFLASSSSPFCSQLQRVLLKTPWGCRLEYRKHGFRDENNILHKNICKVNMFYNYFDFIFNLNIEFYSCVFSYIIFKRLNLNKRNSNRYYSSPYIWFKKSFSSLYAICTLSKTTLP